MVWSVSSSFDKQHSAPPHRCPSRSLFTPSATCHEQADICHVDEIFIGQQRSAYKLACWRFRSSVKLWDGRVSGREGLRAGVWGQECWLVFGPAGGAMLKVWRLGVSRLFAHRDLPLKPANGLGFRWAGRLCLIFSQAVKLNSIARGQ